MNRLSDVLAPPRPPQPKGPWAWAMRWQRLLLAHWPIAADVLGQAVPPSLALDTYDGSAWLGVVPLEMSQVRARRLWPMPGLCRFPLLQVRTYVTADDRPGIYCFSLDASHLRAVDAIRTRLHLPCFASQMTCQSDGTGHTHYLSRRTDPLAPAATFAARYRPVAAPYQAKPGTLEYFLTQRDCLYTTDGHGQCHRSALHYAPAPLQQAQADLQVCEMAGPLGLALPHSPTALHYIHQRDVKLWRPTPVSSPTSTCITP